MNKRFLTAIFSFVIALAAAFSVVAVIGVPTADSATASYAENSALATQVEGKLEVFDAKVTEVVKGEKTASAYDYDTVVSIVSQNRVFGDYIYYDEAILEAAEILLLDRAEEIDGFTYLKKSDANALIYSLYGRKIDESVAVIEGVPERDGYYAVLPIGYDGVSHEIEQITVKEYGRIEVISKVTVEYFDRIEVNTVCTVLSATEGGYIILSADVVE